MGLRTAADAAWRPKRPKAFRVSAVSDSRLWSPREFRLGGSEIFRAIVQGQGFRVRWFREKPSAAATEGIVDKESAHGTLKGVYGGTVLLWELVLRARARLRVQAICST